MPSVRHCICASLAAAALFLLPARADAQRVHADLNGDGVRDRVDVGTHPAELIVRISNESRPQRLQAEQPIDRFTFADIDRDGDPDVVAITVRSGLQIWLNRGRGRFATRAGVPRAPTAPARQSIAEAKAQVEEGGLWDGRTRVIVACSACAGGSPPAAACAHARSELPQSRFNVRRPTPRGPPLTLLS